MSGIFVEVYRLPVHLEFMLLYFKISYTCGYYEVDNKCTFSYNGRLTKLRLLPL